jgi:hypothetical protein
MEKNVLPNARITKKTPAVISRNPTAALRFVYLFCLWVVCDFFFLFFLLGLAVFGLECDRGISDLVGDTTLSFDRPRDAAMGPCSVLFIHLSIIIVLP